MSVLSLDAGKVFDCVEWRNLIFALEKCGFQNFMSLVKIFTHPLVGTRTNYDQFSPPGKAVL